LRYQLQLLSRSYYSVAKGSINVTYMCTSHCFLIQTVVTLGESQNVLYAKLQLNGTVFPGLASERDATTTSGQSGETVRLKENKKVE
jgi:hypothetical protein